MSSADRYAERVERIQRLGAQQRIELFRLVQQRLAGQSDAGPVRELVAFYTAPGDSPQDAALEARARSQLPDFARPRRFSRLDRMPLSANGKIDRNALAALLDPEPDPGAGARAPHSAEAPTSATAKAVEAFQRVLRRSDVGASSNFFELGGHSLLVIECILEIERATGVRIPTAAFFRQPTPAGLSTHLCDTSADPHFTYLYPVNEGLGPIPFFVISASQLAYAIRDALGPGVPVYGLNLAWLDEEGVPFDYADIPDLANRMRAEIEIAARGRPLVIAGSSFPGVVAYEISRQLASAGRTPEITLLFEPTLPSNRGGFLERDLDRLRLSSASPEPVSSGPPLVAWLRLNHPFASRFWRRLYTLLARVPATEVRCLLAHRRAQRGRPIPTRLLPDYTDWRVNSLWSRYQPRSYSGRTALFTSDEHHDAVAPRWLALLAPDSSAHRHQSSHADLLRQPTMSRLVIPAVVKELESVLERFDAGDPC